MSTLDALIVGCGNIAGRFDAARGDAAAFPLTHAGAYTADSRFRLAACVEPDVARRREFMDRWRVSAGYGSIDEAARARERFDVVSICSPTPSHESDLAAALKLAPRVIFCEKPVSTAAASTQRLVLACKDAGVQLAVNYTRRWDPSVADLRKGIEEGRWGRLRCVVGYYNKGLLNNGSHMLDLLCLLLGPLRVLHVGRPVNDFSPDDPTLPVWLEATGEVPVHIVCGHAEDFALFELQFTFSDALVAMEEGGMYWRERKTVPSSEFAGYRVPGEGMRRAGGYPQAMLRSIDNIFAAVRHGQPLASDGDSALAAQRLCEVIRTR
jgi:predicted dehydrogenase